MPIGYNPDVINPNGIDYSEVTDLVNPPNVSNKGKVVGIGDDGRATLIDGGGGGGSVGVLYALDMQPATTDPDIPEGAENVSNFASPVGRSPDDESPMSYGELSAYFEENSVVYIVDQGARCIATGISDTGGVIPMNDGYNLGACLLCIKFMSDPIEIPMYGVFFTFGGNPK